MLYCYNSLMPDPRDKRFFELQKRDFAQLSLAEVKEYIAYCDKMIKFVQDHKSRRGWIREKEARTVFLNDR